ncbi:hypothetical protein Ancab_033324 [Ancistrocladus abbreviatus]
MATVNASHFASRRSHANAAVTESKAKLLQIDLKVKNRLLTHSGLRPLKKVDVLQMKSYVNPLRKQATSTALKTENVRPSSAIICGRCRGMKLVFVGAEVGPWSKTGGLGDVLGGLPAALAALGNRVMTVCPRYDQYADAWDTGVLVEIKVGGRIETVRFFHCHKRGVDRVFVDHPVFLARVWGKTGSKIYGHKTGVDYSDNQFRFSLMCQAALEAPRRLNLNNSPYHCGPYGEDVVFIANDWHSALLPCYLKALYKSGGICAMPIIVLGASWQVVFCIHNTLYQGRHAFSDFPLLNLPDEFKCSFDFTDGYDKPVKGRKINWMKAGILESDRVLTVSPHYAREICSCIAKGVELHDIIRKIGVTGIVNGMDIQEWNPSTDKFIDVRYDATTVMEAKQILKEALQAEVGLPVDRNIPVIGFIGRLEEQKGSDILVAAIPEFIQENVQIIVLGTGKKSMEKQIEQLEIRYPEKGRGVAKFNAKLAHMIIAGADFMLVTSRFEPCGLIQLYAIRYGTLSIVSSTGGLVDTIKEGYTGFQMGSFNCDCNAVDPADVAAVARGVKKALSTYATPAMREMIQNCMAQDLSWKGPAKQWEKILLSLVDGTEPGIEGEEIAPLASENIPAP